MQTKTDNVVVTVLRREYLSQVLEIEESNSQQTNPATGVWTKEDFCFVLAKPNYQGIVAWQGKKIVGFAVYSLSKNKIYIFNMGVHIEHLNQGVCSEIITRLKNKLGSNHCVHLETDVRESNLSTQLFLRKKGFKAIKVVRNWYAQPSEDAYRFQYELECNQ